MGKRKIVEEFERIFSNNENNLEEQNKDKGKLSFNQNIKDSEINNFQKSLNYNEKDINWNNLIFHNLKNYEVELYSSSS